MIPIELTIEGLYSYQQRQTLDFTSLTNAGLFGIFGEVGSGKSSILEAVTFALYGNSDRLGATNFAYNMMNLKSNRLFVEFVFLNHAGKTYKISREYKRNSRHFDRITNSGVALYELQENEWIPLNSSNVEPIIGLSSENFRRTIIIPQGQFKEFIELKPAARTQMMKEIFNLHRFDLQDKVSVLNSKNSDLLSQLEGKLSGFEEVSHERIEELKLQLSGISEAHLHIKKAYDEISARFQHLKALKSAFEELNNKQMAFDRLSARKNETDKQKQQLEDYEQVFNTFHSLLTDRKRLESEFLLKTDHLASERKNLEITDKKISELVEKLEKLKPLCESLPAKRIEENDLGLIAEMLGFSGQVEELKERAKNGNQKVEEVRTKQTEIKGVISGLQGEINVLTEKRIDPQILLDAANWYTKKQYLTETLQKLVHEAGHLQRQIAEIEMRLPVNNRNEKTAEEHYISEKHISEAEKTLLETEKSRLSVQWELSRYAHNMHDGVPCPLCGSSDHPHIIEIEDVTTQLDTVVQKMAALDEKQRTLQENYQETKMLLSQRAFLQKQSAANKEEQEKIQEQISHHLDRFVWDHFSASDPEDFELKKKEAASLELQVYQKARELEKWRQLLEAENEHLDKYVKALEHFRIEEARKEMQFQQNKTKLRTLHFEHFISHTIEDVRKQLSGLIEHNLKTERDYDFLNQQYNELSPKQASQKTSVSIAELQLTDLRKQLSVVEAHIENALKPHNDLTIETVYQILELQLDTVSVRKTIERFTIEYETLKNTIEELRLKLKDVTFDEDAYVNLQQKMEETETALNVSAENRTKTSAELERVHRAFDDKKELLKQKEQLQKRAANLNTLKSLFTAAGFVQYVSSIYLKQLCENANVRFHRMTRNQLSLQLNGNNDFEIIDYLNEGKSRSVKTLSGGQLFQVSLSLALALAESVQLNVKSEKNFFFIDEGFGTQDTDSVNIVFETLLGLQKENRIVGIISHVEELKDRIPVSLTVVKDKEKGSFFVQNDW